MKNGQAFRHTTAAAGGYGDAMERDPQAVLFDVRNGKITIEGAERDYGVKILRSPWRVEQTATDALRQSLRAARGAAA